MRKETIITMSESEFNMLVRKKMSNLTRYPETYTKYKATVELEWDQSARYYAKVTKNDQNSTLFQNHIIAQIVDNDGSTYPTRLVHLITFMVMHGILEAGTYLIDPSY